MKKAKPLPPQVKFQMALEAPKAGKSGVEIARAYNLHLNAVYKYRDALLSKDHFFLFDDTQEKAYKRKIQELEPLIRKKRGENRNLILKTKDLTELKGGDSGKVAALPWSAP